MAFVSDQISSSLREGASDSCPFSLLQSQGVLSKNLMMRLSQGLRASPLGPRGSPWERRDLHVTGDMPTVLPRGARGVWSRGPHTRRSSRGKEEPRSLGKDSGAARTSHGRDGVQVSWWGVLWVAHSAPCRRDEQVRLPHPRDVGLASPLARQEAGASGAKGSVTHTHLQSKFQNIEEKGKILGVLKAVTAERPVSVIRRPGTKARRVQRPEGNDA